MIKIELNEVETLHFCVACQTACLSLTLKEHIVSRVRVWNQALTDEEIKRLYHSFVLGE